MYGDPELTLAAAEFLVEVGAAPVLLATGARNRALSLARHERLPEAECEVLEDTDFATIGAACERLGVDLLLGSSKGYRIARGLGVPLVRLGFPIHDRVGAGRPRAVMRMAPVAIASLADGDVLQNWAIAQAHLTHNHALSGASCILVGRMIHCACLGYSKFQLRRVVDRTIERWPQLAFDGTDNYCSPFVADTMRTVMKHFFTTRTFEHCLVATVNQGGDADTAGAIAGAYYGRDSIPRRWRTAIAPGLHRELEHLAYRLFSCSPLANGQRETSGETGGLKG